MSNWQPITGVEVWGGRNGSGTLNKSVFIVLEIVEK
jgi:hypothetical protein